MRIPAAIGLLFLVGLSLGCGAAASSSGQVSIKNTQHPTENRKETAKRSMDETHEVKLATFGSGCFWCTEAMFERLEGVEKVVSGYSGGHVDNPTYEQVCTGKTGHAESIQITYRPDKVSYAKLLEVFWRTHDPTTKDRQGNDVGPQYRSVIFYHDEEQKKLAEAYRIKLEAEHIWDQPIVTEIVAFTKFWPAESYHQNYYDNNPTKGYCSLVITPKIEKFRKIFKDRLKPER
jgi:peptide-methionine (S)-S-oxide reductase